MDEKKSKKIIKTAVIIGVLVILAGVLSFVAFSGSSAKEMKVYFYPLDSNMSGDSCIITIGDIEILIDAGADDDAPGNIIIEKMKSVCKDKVWDYIIVTHPDSDHIAGFVDEKNGVFNFFEKNSEEYTIKTLIDFDTTRDESVSTETILKFAALFLKDDEEEEVDSGKKATGYLAYSSKRDALILNGVIQNYYTASECCWKARNVEQDENGATNVFDLGNGATLNILYNYMYDYENPPGKNMVSVCSIIKYGEHSFLFTGDLEQGYSGEKLLVENNKDVIPHNVTMYKAGHHGSNTSSSQSFIDYIRPQHVVFSGAAGSHEYNYKYDENRFPAMAVTDRIFAYTDRMYIISECKGKDEYVTYYGDITFTSDGENISVETQYETLEDGKTPKPIQDTEWFSTNRNDVFNVYTFFGDNNGESNCTLIKYGHTELLIDCGMNTVGSQKRLVDKVKEHCNDGVIEYAVVTNSQSESLGGFIGDTDQQRNSLENGLFDILEFGTLIEFSASNYDLSNPKREGASALAQYQEKNDVVNQVKSAIDIVNKENGVIKINGWEHFTISVLETGFYQDTLAKHDEDDYSVCCLITFREKKLLFLGDLTDGAGAMENMLENSGVKDKIADVDYYRVPNYGADESYNAKFLTYIKPKFVVLDCMANMHPPSSSKDEKYPGIDHAVALNVVSGGNVYLTGELKNGKNTVVCGDITYTIKSKNGKVADPIVSEGEIQLNQTDWWKDNVLNGE